MKYESGSTRDYAGSMPFTVSGGPFAKPQHMGWHITDEKGFTIAVSCDSRFAQRINNMEEFISLFKELDCLYQISERYDQGYMNCVYDKIEHFKDLIKEL